MKTVVGMFDQFDDARRAVQDLRDAGFANEDISMIARDEGGEYSRYLEGDKMGDKENMGDGAAAGAGLGAVLGGLGGLLVGLGALMIPGIGPVIAAGPIITTLAGAGVGAVAGGVVGALVDLGIPDEHANYYAEGVRRGGTLVVLRADDMRADMAADIMNRYHPVDVERRASDWRASGDWKGFDANASEYRSTGMSQDRDYNRQHNASAIPVTGTDDIDDRGGLDDLTHGHDYNRDSGTGMGAGTHRDMDDDDLMDHDNDIPVTGSGYGSDRDLGTGGGLGTGATGGYGSGMGTGSADLGTGSITDDDEDFGTGRSTLDSGSLHHSGQDYTSSGSSAQDFGRDRGLGMNDPSSRQNFGDQGTGSTDRDYNTGVGNQGYNRGTTADDRDFNQSGYRSSGSDMDNDIPITGGRMTGETYPTTRSGSDMGTMGGDWADYDAQFRSDYQTRFGSTNQSYAYYQPAYRFGYDLRSEQQYRDWDWDRLEPVARQEWQRRGLVGAWEDFKDAVRHAWDSVRY